jgi:hypothetical protein
VHFLVKGIPDVVRSLRSSFGEALAREPSKHYVSSADRSNICTKIRVANVAQLYVVPDIMSEGLYRFWVIICGIEHIEPMLAKPKVKSTAASEEANRASACGLWFPFVQRHRAVAPSISEPPNCGD